MGLALDGSATTTACGEMTSLLTKLHFSYYELHTLLSDASGFVNLSYQIEAGPQHDALWGFTAPVFAIHTRGYGVQTFALNFIPS
jgi:hypothetical protein